MQAKIKKCGLKLHTASKNYKTLAKIRNRELKLQKAS